MQIATVCVAVGGKVVIARFARAFDDTPTSSDHSGIGPASSRIVHRAERIQAMDFAVAPTKSHRPTQASRRESTASPPEALPSFGANTPLGRPGQPAELAPIYVLLASNDSSYSTGQIYGATGGCGGP